MRDKRVLKIDLHGYHPNDIVGDPLTKIIQQAWEMGAQRIQFIHGHGYAAVLAASEVVEVAA